MGLFGSGKSDFEKISDLIDKGLDLMANEKYQKAYDCFNKAIKIDPKYPGAWHNKGWASLVLENHEEAITCYDEAICLGISQHEQNPRNPFPSKSLLDKAYVLGNLGKHEESVTCFNQILENNPDHDMANYMLGLSLYQLEKYEESVVYFDKVIKLYEDEGLLEPHSFTLFDYDHEFPNRLQLGLWASKSRSLFKLKKYELLVECASIAIDMFETWVRFGGPNATTANYNRQQFIYLWQAKGEGLKNLGLEAESDHCMSVANDVESNSLYFLHSVF
ncbi:MAG: tetratricopeptide repeat protein [Thaumarchaeota archaeon]|jgi:tetratricopeptide (TPR) repeat protein|nr:tetratricopeptide repeat protein [Nitrososphaerota archaeon]